MAITNQVIQQRIPFVDAQGRLSNEGTRALNDAFRSIFDQVSQVLELFGITDQLTVDLSALSSASVVLSSPSAAFDAGLVLTDGTGIGITIGTGTITVGFDGNTNDVPEGSNLYFTTARARAAVSGSGTITYTSATGVFSLTQANVVAALGYTPVAPGGGLTLGIRTTTAAPTLTANDHTILCNAAAGAIPVALPSAASMTGRELVFKKIDASGNAVTITPNGAETIDGAGSLPLNSQWARATIQSNGVGWFVL